VAELEKLIVSLQADLKQYEREMARANSVTVSKLRGIERQAQASATRIQSSFSRVGSSIKGGLLAAFTIGGLTALAREAQDAVKEIADLDEAAKKAGVSVEDLQRLSFAGLAAGLTQEDIVGLLNKLNRELAKMRDAGIPVQDTVTEFLKLTDAIKSAADPIEQARIAQEKLGKSGRQAIPVLIQGSVELKKQMDQAAVASAELAAAADKFYDEWAQTFKNWGTLFNKTIATALINMQALFTKTEELSLKQLETQRSAAQQVLDANTFSAPDALDDFITKVQDLLRLKEVLGTDVEGDISSALGGREALRKSIADLDVLIAKKKELLKQEGEPPDLINVPDDEDIAALKRTQKEIENERERIDELIVALQGEYDALNTTQLQQAIDTELRKAGAEATEEQRQAIIELVTAIEAQTNAQARAALEAENVINAQKEAADKAEAEAKRMEDAFESAFSSLVEAAGDGTLKLKELMSVLNGLRDQLLRMAAEKIFQLVLGALIGPAGGAPSTIGLVPGMAGRQSGGHVNRGDPYTVGERGPEIFVPSQSGTVVPNGGGSGGRSGYGKVVINNYGAAIEQSSRSGASGMKDLIVTVKAITRSEFPALLNEHATIIGGRPVSRRTV